MAKRSRPSGTDSKRAQKPRQPISELQKSRRDVHSESNQSDAKKIKVKTNEVGKRKLETEDGGSS